MVLCQLDFKYYTPLCDYDLKMDENPTQYQCSMIKDSNEIRQSIVVAIRESEICCDLKIVRAVKSQCCKTKRIPAGFKTIYPNISRTDFNLHICFPS